MLLLFFKLVYCILPKPLKWCKGLWNKACSAECYLNALTLNSLLAVIIYIYYILPESSNSCYIVKRFCRQTYHKIKLNRRPSARKAVAQVLISSSSVTFLFITSLSRWVPASGAKVSPLFLTVFNFERISSEKPSTRREGSDILTFSSLDHL